MMIIIVVLVMIIPSFNPRQQMALLVSESADQLMFINGSHSISDCTAFIITNLFLKHQ